jgi:hypothetical protein
MDKQDKSLDSIRLLIDKKQVMGELIVDTSKPRLWTKDFILITLTSFFISIMYFHGNKNTLNKHVSSQV